MKHHTGLLLMLVILAGGCLTDSGEKLSSVKAVSAASIQSVAVSGRVVSVVARCVVPEPCWAFANTEYSRTNDTFAVTVFAGRTTSGPCVEVLSSVDATFKITVDAAGSYTFQFWRYDGTTLDTTVVVH